MTTLKANIMRCCQSAATGNPTKADSDGKAAATCNAMVTYGKESCTLNKRLTPLHPLVAVHMLVQYCNHLAIEYATNNVGNASAHDPGTVPARALFQPVSMSRWKQGNMQTDVSDTTALS